MLPLVITITPGTLYFDNLTDELFEELQNALNLKEQRNGKGYYIDGPPEQLYKILVKLSYVYDIELK